MLRQGSPRTNLDIAQELHQLLHNAEIPGPYVYVGSFNSAFTGRLFATEYPDEVAGLVLVDPQHPDWDAKVLELLPSESASEPDVVGVLRYQFTVNKEERLRSRNFWNIGISTPA